MRKMTSQILNILTESEDLSIYADFSEFPEIVAKGKDENERKNLFYRCYVSNPSNEEMTRWTIEDLVEYIYDTDEYWSEDLPYIIKCAKLSGASDDYINKIKENR